MRRRRWLWIGLATALVLLGGRAAALAVLELRWFTAMGAADLWWARTLTSVSLRTACAAAAALFAFANLLAVRHSVVSLVLPRRVGNIEIGEEVPGRSLVLTAALLASVIGVLLALPMNDWTSALLARYGRPFAESDPYLQRDLGFYLYWLPFETALYEWALVTIAVVVTIVVLLYALTPSLRWDRRTLYVSGYVRRHLVMLGGVMLLLLAWSYRLDDYHLLLDGSGPAGLFTSVDHRVGIPGSLLLSIVCLGAALVVIFAGWTGQTRLAFLAMSGVLLAVVIVRVIAPAVVGREGGSGTAAALRERPYLATRAGYSRRAFGVDRIERTDSRAVAPTPAQLPLAISAWDEGALAAAIDPRLSSELEASLGWQSGADGLTAVLPVLADSGDDENPAWSIVRVDASIADDAGDPVRVGGAVALAGNRGSALIVRPGEDGHVLRADAGGRVVGVPVRSRRDRLLYAWALQDLSLVAGDGARVPSTLTLHRDVRARVRALAPFLAQGQRVSPIVLGDTLYWQLDLYAASRFYPLSHPLLVNGREWSYLQRVAVALVQAQTGRTMLVLDGAPEPIIESWRRAFPRLFRARSELAPAVARALPPPIEQSFVQTLTFARYGSRTEGDRERGVPLRDGADARLVGDVTPMRLSDGTIAVVHPVLDGDERITGFVVTTGGPTRTTRWLRLATPGPQWPLMVDRLRAESRAVAASRLPIVRGPVRAVPIDGGTMLLQSAYSWREDRPPTLVRVVVATGDSLRAGPALVPLLGAADGTGPHPGSASTLREQVRALYDSMRAALRRGDLGGFGAAFDSLGRTIGRSSP